MTRVLDPDPDRRITPPVLYENRPDDELDLVDQHVLDLDSAARSQVTEAIVGAARQHDRVISATGTIVSVHDQLAAASSNGFVGRREATTASLSAMVTLRGEGDERPEGYFGANARHLEEIDALGTAVVGTTALNRATARIGATQGTTRRTTMVVEPWMAGSLIRRLLGPANAEAISQERSYFRGRMNEQLFAERLEIIDEPLRRRGLGSRHFDGEGISARRLPIVTAGRPTHLYVDTYYGSKAELTPTTGSSSNLVVTPGDQSMAQLMSDAGEGILITSWLGGNSDATTGEFSIGMRGHLIESGQIGQAVGEMNVSGNLLELFTHLGAVGNDPWPWSRYAVPTLVFENVQFSGA